MRALMRPERLAKENAMSKYVIENVVVSYTPGSVSDDGMTETREHFTAACPLGDKPIGFMASGLSEDDAVCKLREKYAEAINAGKVPGIDAPADDHRKVYGYEIDSGRIVRIEYPAAVLEKALADEHKAALRMNEAFDRDARVRVVEERYKREKEAYLAGISTKGISFGLEADGAIKVWGMSEYNPHMRKSEYVFKTRTFPRNKAGSWSWAKIRDHIRLMSNHIEAREKGEAARSAVRDKAQEIANRLGFDKYSSAWQPGQKCIQLNVFVAVEKFEEVVKAIRACGVVLK